MLTEHNATQQLCASQQTLAATCRAAVTCEGCVQLDGCGWSVVRKSCFAAHPVATDDTCVDEDGAARSVDEWLADAKRLTDPDSAAYGPRSLRAAYRALERAVEAERSSWPSDGESAGARLHSIEAALAELAAKLEAVFDDEDARELLERTRHAGLAAVHAALPAVPRRSLDEALGFFERAEPVVLTGLFSPGAPHADAPPAVRKWTLDYLHRVAFGGRTPATHGAPKRGEALLNVATDARGACCRYYEPRRASAAAGYPYP